MPSPRYLEIAFIVVKGASRILGAALKDHTSVSKLPAFAQQTFRERHIVEMILYLEMTAIVILISTAVL
jgi:hypothetical protein